MTRIDRDLGTTLPKNQNILSKGEERIIIILLLALRLILSYINQIYVFD